MGSFYSTKNVCIVEAEAPPISNGITLVHCSAISPFVTIWTIIFMTIIISYHYTNLTFVCDVRPSVTGGHRKST